MAADSTTGGAGTLRQRPLQAAQGLVEYVLILALVAVVALGATSLVGGQIASSFSNVADVMSGLTTGDGGSAPPATSVPQPTPVPPSAYSKKGTCQAAGYTWKAKTKTTPAHCE
jgi:Flp pilus assembly pilin Flp